MKRNMISAIALGALALSASAQYKVVVTTTDGEKKEYETSNVESIRFEEAPVYNVADYLIAAQYTSKGDNGIYYLSFGTTAPDSNGDPVGIGDLQVSLELTGALSENYLDAQLPAGYYRAGSGANHGEFNVQRSGMWVRIQEGADGVTLAPMIDGTVDVRRDGENYELKCEFTLLTGDYVAVSYTGPITFAPGLSENVEFTTDQDIKFEGAQERYFANWFYPFADDVTLELYTGTFDANGSQEEGYWMNLSVYMPKAADAKNPEQYLADGVYSIEKREKVVDNTYLPYTLQMGGTIDFWGMEYPAGSYITYLDKSGKVMRAFIADGTMTVSEKGTKITLDMVADNGIKITGEYSGNVVIDNRNDSETAPAIEGTIDKDTVMDFLPGTIGMSYPLGDYIKSGVYQFSVMITESSMEHGDFLMLELSSTEEILPDGTYTINNEFADFSGIKGFINYARQPMFSWFGNLDDVDEEGVQNIVAPIMGGTVTISTTADNTRKLVFDLLDEDNHKITGTYEGIFYNLPAQAPAKAPLLKSASPAAAQAPVKLPVADRVRL